MTILSIDTAPPGCSFFVLALCESHAPTRGVEIACFQGGPIPPKPTSPTGLGLRGGSQQHTFGGVWWLEVLGGWSLVSWRCVFVVIYQPSWEWSWDQVGVESEREPQLPWEANPQKKGTQTNPKDTVQKAPTNLVLHPPCFGPQNGGFGRGGGRGGSGGVPQPLGPGRGVEGWSGGGSKKVTVNYPSWWGSPPGNTCELQEFHGVCPTPSAPSK